VSETHIPGASLTRGAQPMRMDPWLKMANDAYTRSTTYFDNNYRKTWDDNLRMFQSKHPRDSKYMSDAYKYRSRIFRPKSRSVVRKNEATAALAFFSNPDVVSIDPVDDANPAQAWSALVMKEIMQYRLTKTIPWFLTVIGGFQDAMTVGLVCSMQIWRYRQKMEKKKVKTEHPLLGEVEIEIEAPKVIEDRPCIDLFPIENVRFDPAAQWHDVVGTSPYVILQIPMYVNDVLDNMESEDRAGRKWKRLDKKTILEARVEGMDPLRQTRNDNREDAEAVTSDVNEFDVVMTHLNFIRSGDTTYAYYTLKDKHVLTEPMPVEEMFLHCKDGRPPVQVGFCVIETHKPVPTSKIGLTSELQRETNEIGNQRLDNVKFVLNKRWLIRRGANIDVESLLRNVPGGVTMVNNVETDALPVNWQDVTSSSFQEQDRVNVDFDELAGNFAQSSVLTNRKLNETVGGMRMMSQGANMMTEYDIRVFVETWVEPVLRQLVKLEEAYETDQVVLGVAGQKSGYFQKFGRSAPLDALLGQELTLSVNVGMGATDPDMRLQRFVMASQTYNQIAMQGSPDQNLPEIRKTIFGLAGFRDSSRFFKEVDPMVVRAQQMAQEAEAKAKQIIDGAKDSMNRRERMLDEREHKMDLELVEARNEFIGEARKAQQEFMLEMSRQRGEMELKERAQAHDVLMKRDKAAQEMAIARQKAQDEAAIKTFEAKLEASLKVMLAEVERKLTIAKTRMLEKQGPGKWKVTEQ
jgi:hypothetical protein